MPSFEDDPDDPREATRQVPVTTATFRKGEVLAGKYRIEKVLGRGGMGHVFAAMHLDLDQLVAIKVMHKELLDDADAVMRFGREAKAAAAMRGPHTARIFDVGKLESSGQPYMVMEYLEGRDLAALVDTGARVEISDALEWLAQACDGVAEAHDLGMVHRDIKPHNLFLTRDRNGKPVVKVLDFGLAKALSPTPGGKETASANAFMLGSPYFMSPEQARGHKLDPRTDVWSLGATLYTVVTGKPPFDGPTISEVCAALLMDDFPPISTRRPDAPPELEMLVRACLQKDVAKRLGTVREMLEGLRAIQAGRPLTPSLSDFQSTVRMQQQSSPSWNDVPAAVPAPASNPMRIATPHPRTETPSVRGTLPMNAHAYPRGAQPTVRKKKPPRALYWAIIAFFLVATAVVIGVGLYMVR